jgi:hypothetical protein
MPPNQRPATISNSNSGTASKTNFFLLELARDDALPADRVPEDWAPEDRAPEDVPPAEAGTIDVVLLTPFHPFVRSNHFDPD